MTWAFENSCLYKPTYLQHYVLCNYHVLCKESQDNGTFRLCFFIQIEDEDGWVDEETSFSSYLLKIKQYKCLNINSASTVPDMKFVNDTEGESLTELAVFCNLGTEIRKHKNKGLRNVNLQSGAGAIWWHWLTAQLASWNLLEEEKGDKVCRLEVRVLTWEKSAPVSFYIH